MNYRLPFTLENILTGLLHERNISGWKLLAEKQVTLVIRFSDLPGDPISIQGSGAKQPSVSYRRKPPSTVERDNSRYARWNERKQGSVSANFDQQECSILTPSTPCFDLSTNNGMDSGLGEAFCVGNTPHEEDLVSNNTGIDAQMSCSPYDIISHIPSQMLNAKHAELTSRRASKQKHIK